MTPARIAVSNPMTPADAKVILDALDAHGDYSMLRMSIRYRLLEWADYVGFKGSASKRWRRSRIALFQIHLKRLATRHDKAQPKA